VRYTKEFLLAFSEIVRDEFSDAKICGPIHLSGNQEDDLIEIFKNINSDDWVFSTHRSHYHALLHGVDKDWLLNEIRMGRSITIENRAKRFITSAIVAGILPMALGVALGIKRQGITGQHVWAFVGEMTAEGGIFHEVVKYASRHRLPLSIVIEDNGFSTNTPTEVVWGDRTAPEITIMRYSYERRFPHQGCGKWVQF
jgi:TPP-dependent pyruvate/acetoin dehydrogenase alpha subunit